MRELVFDLQRFADKITYDDSVMSFLKILADLDKKLGLTKLADFLEADNNNRYNTEDFSATIKFLGALYKTINKDTPLNDGAVLISTIIDIVKESVQISVDVDEGKKSADEIKKSVVKLVSKYTTALDKLTKLTEHKTSFLLIGAAAIALSANFITSLDISTDEEAREQLSSLLKDEVNLAKEVLNTCIKKFFSDDLSASLFNGKIVDNDITAPLGSIALASSAFTGIISGVMTFFDEVEHYKEDGIPEDIAIKDAVITAVATAVKETANKYTKGFDDVAFKVIQDFMSFVTKNEVDELFADKSYTELIVENLKTFNYTNTGTADDNELVSYENGKMIYGYDGNDYIGNIASNVTIFGGHDNDTIFSRKGSGDDYPTPQSNSILGGPGNDWLIAYDINSSVYGGTGDDRIAVYGTKNKIFGEDGKDAILFGDGADNNTANGGLGDDIIILESVKNAVIEYSEGDGNDIVLGYDESDIISITGEYSTQTSGADVIIVVGTDSITLNEAAGKNININNKRSVIGESLEGGTTTFTTLPSLWNDGINPYDSVKSDDSVKPVDEEKDSKTINGKKGGDTINNTRNGMTINLSAGNNSVSNSGKSVTINGGTGDDSISNSGDLVRIDAGDGKDAIESWSDSVIIDGGDDKDYIKNYGFNISIDGGAGNDLIVNYYGQFVTINAGDGDDDIYNDHGANVKIDGSEGNDFIDNYSLSSNVTIDGGDGNDSIHNYDSDSVTIDGGDGNDSIENCNGDSVTIDGGTGDDTINLLYGTTNLIQYASSDGNDIIQGFKLADTLSISGGSYSSVKNDNDVILTVGDGKISLVGAASLSTLNIIGTYAPDTTGGDSSTSTTTGGGSSTSTVTGGGSSSTTKGDSSSSSTVTGGGSSSTTKGGSSSTSTVTGGGSSSTTKGDSSSTSTVTGGGSSSTTKGGSSSTSTTTGGGSSSTTKGGSSTSTTTGGGSSSASTVWDNFFSTSATKSDSSSSTSTTRTTGSTTTHNGNSSTSTTRNNSSTSTSTSDSSTRNNNSSTSTASNQNIYTGGDKTISNYSGQAVTLGAYTGANFNGSDFFVSSATGTLAIQNTADKVIDIVDANGNAFIKAYTPSTAGVIDGRGLAGYEIISGSANGTDVIFAGDGGSSLWGGSGLDADALVGGNGSDIFVGGRFQGSDNIFNASSADAVNLTDATLSDIVAAVGGDGNIAIGFNTGNIINIQSMEVLSAAINLADNSSWRFNHVTKSWQSA